jgi:hypothetical protein
MRGAMTKWIALIVGFLLALMGRRSKWARRWARRLADRASR